MGDLASLNTHRLHEGWMTCFLDNLCLPFGLLVGVWQEIEFDIWGRLLPRARQGKVARMVYHDLQLTSEVLHTDLDLTLHSAVWCRR